MTPVVSLCLTVQLVEPRVGAARAGRLDEDSRSHGGRRHGVAPLGVRNSWLCGTLMGADPDPGPAVIP